MNENQTLNVDDADIRGGGLHRYVVHNVGTTALAGKEHACVVGMLRKPWIGEVCNPPERRPSILVGCRDGVLWREPVIHRDNKRPSTRGEVRGVTMEQLGEGTPGAKGATMEVDNDREPLPGGSCIKIKKERTDTQV